MKVYEVRWLKERMIREMKNDMVSRYTAWTFEMRYTFTRFNHIYETVFPYLGIGNLVVCKKNAYHDSCI